MSKEDFITALLDIQWALKDNGPVTPAPWVVATNASVSIVPTKDGGWMVAQLSSPMDREDRPTRDRALANGALITALRNHAEIIVKALELAGRGAEGKAK
jgi:hypothetical protein